MGARAIVEGFDAAVLRDAVADAVADADADASNHIGLINVRERIKLMCEGTLDRGLPRACEGAGLSSVLAPKP